MLTRICRWHMITVQYNAIITLRTRAWPAVMAKSDVEGPNLRHVAAGEGASHCKV